MADKEKNPFGRRIPVSRPFLTTRLSALRVPASHFTQYMTESTVYGVVVDMPMGGNVITTLACYINGGPLPNLSKEKSVSRTRPLTRS